MNINQLKKNMSFKNYRALCDFLGISVLAGNSKQAQFNELARHCHLVKVGHHIFVEEVYDSPIENVGRGRKGVYNEILQQLIMDFFVGQSLSEICITRNTILCKIGMMNEQFVYDEKKISHVENETNIPREILFDFFNTTNKVFKSAFEVVLKNLSQKGLIHYNTTLMLAYHSNSNINHMYREATSEEVANIKALETLALKHFGYASMKEVNFSKPRSKKFTKLVIQLYNERHSTQQEEIQFCYSAHKILLNKQLTEKQLLNFLLDSKKKESLQDELNRTLSNQLCKNAIKRHQQALESDMSDFITQIRRSERYVPYFEELITRLIVGSGTSTKTQ